MNGRKRVFRATRRTPEEVASDRIVREVFRNRPDMDALVERGEVDPAEMTTLGEYLGTLQAIAELKQARIRQGLSLTDVSERSGLDRAAISKLENGHQPNPTLATLARYASSMGKRVRLVVDDSPASESSPPDCGPIPPGARTHAEEKPPRRAVQRKRSG